jgi:SPP1 gp7 family putative phage head morphogenesis protein
MADAAPFAVDPLEAIAYLLRKLNIPTETWTDIWQEAHAAAFVVAGAQSDALLNDFHEAVNRAIAEGRTLEQFREDFDRIVAEHGWSYNGSRNWRSRVIFQTNLRLAYAAGRWEQIDRLKARRPYLRYVAVMDERTRPLHAAWHNTVLPVDHPWWDTHFPPNGWNCRCTVQSLGERDLARYGLAVSAEAPPSPLVAKAVKGRGIVMVPEGIDPGFAYNPGKAGLAVKAAEAIHAPG